MKGNRKKHRVNNPIKNQKIALAIIVIGLIIIGLLFFSGYIKPPSKEAPKRPSPTAFVTITSSGFNPATLLISKGETVQWVNNDSKTHQPASNPHPVHDNLPGFDAKEPMKSGETYLFTFEQTGTFGYHDHINPTTNASVVVK